MTERIRKRIKKDKQKLDLTSMSTKELKQLRAKINFLVDNSTDDINDSNYQTFYSLLTDSLNRTLLNTYQPFPVFKKQKTQYNKLVEVVDYLDQLVQDTFAKPKKLFYMKIYRLYITLVKADLTNSPIPLGIPTILNYKSKFAGILDNNFPGYLENGLFRVLFDKKLK
jgi:hypothetical protein